MNRIKPIIVLVVLLLLFSVLQFRVPLATSVQIGADEGFELAKATLCLKGYKLYSDVWCDHPPLHTWLITQAAKLQRNEPLTPALSPSDGERENSVGTNRQDALFHYSALGPRLVSLGFAALILMAVFVMAYCVGRERTQGTQREGEVFRSVLSVRSFAAPLWMAAVAAVLLMGSPGFLELSSSCMMEIPALSPAVAGLCVLLIGRQNKWHSREIFAGILFGIALGMKLLGVILLPLAALIIWLRCREAEVGRVTKCAPNPGKCGDGAHGVTRPTIARDTVSKGRVKHAPSIIRLTCSLFHFLSFAMTAALTFVTLDLLIDRGAFLKHFQQTWVSHFAPTVSFDYGSPSDHRFPPSLLLKNWDMTIPAVVGILVLLRRFRENPIGILPVAWFALMLVIFATHTPWWSYYYVHIAIPLSCCAAIGMVFVCSSLTQKVAARSRDQLSPTHSPTHPLTRLFSPRRPRQIASAVLLAGFALCAVVWMSARVYLQITGIRNSPQTYYSLVLKEIERFKPFTEWIYADNLTYSFHSNIPMPPQLAVVSLKRLWSGDMTVAGVGNEVRKFKPGLIALRNDTRELPFQDLLDTEYRLVYQDAANRLYAHRSIANKANQ